MSIPPAARVEQISARAMEASVASDSARARQPKLEGILLEDLGLYKYIDKVGESIINGRLIDRNAQTSKYKARINTGLALVSYLYCIFNGFQVPAQKSLEVPAKPSATSRSEWGQGQCLQLQDQIHPEGSRISMKLASKRCQHPRRHVT